MFFKFREKLNMELKNQKKNVSKKVSRLLFSDANIVFPDNSLLSIQRDSYSSFVGSENEEGRLSLTLRKFFPICNNAKTVELHYVKCRFGEPRYSVEDCFRREMTYSAPIFTTFRIVSHANEKQSVREQEMYIGEMPLMTDGGSFVVNGVERVIVSQIHRSPGVIFGHDSGKSHSSGRLLYHSKIIPYRGSWIDFEFDYKGIVHSKIDKKRKLPATTILMSLSGLLQRSDLKNVGLSDEVISRIDSSKKKSSKSDDGIEITRSKILQIFYDVKSVKLSKQGLRIGSDFFSLIGASFDEDVADLNTSNVLFHKGYSIDKDCIDRIKRNFPEDFSDENAILMNYDFVLGGAFGSDVIDPSTGEVLFFAGSMINKAGIEMLLSKGVKNIEIIFPQEINNNPYIIDTLNIDKNMNAFDALCDVYKTVRPGDVPSPEGAKTFFRSIFFDESKYDLSDVGRIRINERLGLSIPESHSVLTPSDFLAAVFMLIKVKNGQSTIDDIDSLTCRRIRSVGELFENQCYIGVSRAERSMTDNINAADPLTVMPSELVGKFLDMSLRDCVVQNQLSQFMDQTNLLSELSHKRRISALGPGALVKGDKTIELRDVHPSHYGRICPIETPEGSNLGIVSSPSVFARINKYGFFETPYYTVKNGIVSDEMTYLSAAQEKGHKIAQYTDKVGNKIRDDGLITVRCDGNYLSIPANEVTLCDVSSCQAFSIATSIIPLMEQDEAHRALMGANMQRQAVPLIKPDRPIVGTGWEGYIAQGSGVAVTSKCDGVVVKADANVVCVQPDNGFELEVYHLKKYLKSNAGTCVNQRLAVAVGDRVNKGDVLSDGPCVNSGEIALGKNVKVAFLSFFGRNFEDSVVVSERVAEMYTSVHLVEVVCKVMEGKGIVEELTNDIPGASGRKISHLNEVGLPMKGSVLSAGDYLVGKTRQDIFDSKMTPEDKLLRSIFGDVALNVKDVSLKVPIGIKNATVVDVQVLTKRGVEKDSFVHLVDRMRLSELKQEFHLKRKYFFEGFKKSLLENIYNSTSGGSGALAVSGVSGASGNDSEFKNLSDESASASAKHDIKNGINDDNDKKIASSKKSKSNESISVKIGSQSVELSELEEVLSSISFEDLFTISSSSPSLKNQLQNMVDFYRKEFENLHRKFENDKDNILRGDDLPSGVSKMVKVTLAIKRPLRAGDKMAGRHGNKGVVSCVLPVEDMPFTEDGTPIDIVLTPVGVPSRMNVGQITETVLGWGLQKLGVMVRDLLMKIANDDSEKNIQELRSFLKSIYSKNIIENGKFVKGFDIDSLSIDALISFANGLTNGVHVASCIFDGASEEDVLRILSLAGLDVSGKCDLYDGRTGEKFDRPVTVGTMHYLKLHHLVDEKIHARAVGPYSLVTQQPLGGKAQFGGQRLGEMEVWALEAYGAAHVLREMLTVKSDSTDLKTKTYLGIISGDTNYEGDGAPASFELLVKEMQALCINVDLSNKGMLQNDEYQRKRFGSLNLYSGGDDDSDSEYGFSEINESNDSSSSSDEDFDDSSKE